MKAAKFSLLAISAHSIGARFLAELHPGLEPEKYLIELAPDDTRWVTEDEKWKLRRDGKRFFDITDHRELGATRLHTTTTSVFPKTCHLQDKVRPLIKKLDKAEIQKNLEKFTSFHTRYFKSDYGRQSSEWLLSKINSIIKDAGADNHVYAKHFPHTWQQSSIIVTIPGKSNSTVVIGAHQDSINLWLPSILAAPGADDDGSGSMTILEAFRTLIRSKDIITGKAENTIEFHWYSAEEGGLLGSQAIFSSYVQEGRDVKAMLQQDMTGFVQRTLDAGEPESVGVVTDFVDPALTSFIKQVIVEYCKVPYVETKCGYACSDHASASKAGYPSAFVIESAFEYSNNHIHSVDDVIRYMSFDHMLEHAKMTLGLVYELGFTDFASLEKTESDIVSEEL